jgi:hypothetical protein
MNIQFIAPAVPRGSAVMPWTPVAGPFHRDPLSRVPPIHVVIRTRLSILEPVGAEPGNPAQLHHSLDAQSPIDLHFFLGFR